MTPSRFESSFYLVCSDLHIFSFIFSKHLLHVCCHQILKIITKAKSVKLEQGPEHPGTLPEHFRTPLELDEIPRKSPDRHGKQPRTHVRMQYKANKNLKQRGD